MLFNQERRAERPVVGVQGGRSWKGLRKPWDLRQSRCCPVGKLTWPPGQHPADQGPNGRLRAAGEAGSERWGGSQGPAEAGALHPGDIHRVGRKRLGEWTSPSWRGGPGGRKQSHQGEEARSASGRRMLGLHGWLPSSPAQHRAGCGTLSSWSPSPPLGALSMPWGVHGQGGVCWCSLSTWSGVCTQSRSVVPCRWTQSDGLLGKRGEEGMGPSCTGEQVTAAIAAAPWRAGLGAALLGA